MRLAAEPRADARPRRLGVVDGGSPGGAARHSKAAPPGLPPFPPLRVRQKGAIAKRCSMIPILPAPKPARSGQLFKTDLTAAPFPASLLLCGISTEHPASDTSAQPGLAIWIAPFALARLDPVRATSLRCRRAPCAITSLSSVSIGDRQVFGREQRNDRASLIRHDHFLLNSSSGVAIRGQGNRFRARTPCPS